MQFDLLIKRTLRDAQGILRANLPPAKNLPDAQAVKSLRAIVRTPQIREALERGNDTALCFVLRAVNRILSMRNVDSRIHSLRFDCCVFLFYSFSTVTFATQSALNGRGRTQQR
jgi:hypothetical protein